MTPEPPLEFHENSHTQPFNPALMAKLEGSKGLIFSLDWSPDSRMLAWAGYGQIKLWDAMSHKETQTILQGHTGDIWGLAWSPDGSTLASASQDGTVKLWNAANWQNIADLKTGAWTFCVSWSPDGKRLAAGLLVGTLSEESQPGSFTGKSQIWDVETHQLVREFGVSSVVISTAWSPDGHILAIGQWDGKITFWDGETDTAQKSLVATTERSDVNGLEWSPDGRMLASAHQDGKVRIWNRETGEITMTLEGKNGWLRGVTWSPDGKMLASTGENAEIRVWRMQDGQMLACLTPDSLPTWSLKWSPDGCWLAAGNGIFESGAIGAKVLIFKMPITPDERRQ